MALKDAIRPCPICDNGTVEVLHHQGFTLPEDYILPSGYDVVWCPVCGFAYADTSATQEQYDRYYAAFSKYEDSATATGGGTSGWDARRLRETAEAIAKVAGDREQSVLDIGCANGGLLAVLKKLGFRKLLGVDPSAACAANARRIHDIPAAVGFIRKMPLALGRFDLVILSHVLEHVADLKSAVTDLSGLLTERGLLYIEVPDAARYRQFLLAPFQDFNTEHINHFGLSALRNLFAHHGFVALSTGQKEIESSPGCPYPAAYGFFRRVDEGVSSNQPPVYEIDQSFRVGLVDYIDASREQIAAIDKRLSPFCSPSRPVMVWGAGQLAMKLLAETALARAHIIAFIDTNPIQHGRKLAGIPIISPQNITDTSSPIIIATMLHQKEITESIRTTFRLPNPIVALDSSQARAGLQV